MPELDSSVTVFVVLSVVIAIISVAKNLNDIILSWRRKPSLDKEFQAYMPRKEIEGHIREIKEDNRNVWRRINAMDKTNRSNQEDIQRALGRIEGAILKEGKGQ